MLMEIADFEKGEADVKVATVQRVRLILRLAYKRRNVNKAHPTTDSSINRGVGAVLLAGGG